MKNKRTVLLFGESLIIATIGTFLHNREELEVVHLEAELPGSHDAIQRISPDVILFDVATVRMETALSFLEDQPNLRLIGINLSSGTMLVLCGHHTRAMTADDLFQTIFMKDNHSVLTDA
jgi:hypothetical protein